MGGYEASHDLGKRFRRRKMQLETGHLSYLLRPAAGPPLVLIPGSFNDSFALKEVIDRLDSKRQVVVVELRGHGGSWPPPKKCSIEVFAQDVLSVADVEDLNSFYVGGHSIGGMVALEVARVRPQNVRGVISLEGWTSHHVSQDAFGGQTTNTLSAGQQAQYERLRQRVMALWSEAEIGEFVTYWRQWDGFDFLSKTGLPILELYGDRGQERPSLDKLRIPERENIQVHWLQNASHNLHIECPREVARICDRFVEKLEGAGT